MWPWLQTAETCIPSSHDLMSAPESSANNCERFAKNLDLCACQAFSLGTRNQREVVVSGTLQIQHGSQRGIVLGPGRNLMPSRATRGVGFGGFACMFKQERWQHTC